MSNNDPNKELVSKAKKLFEDKGYQVKTSHLYDIFAQMAGYRNWHVASAQNAQLTNAFTKYIQEENVSTNEKHFLENIEEFFISSLGQKNNFSLFNSNLPAFNYSITGGTGSGKTVLVNKILNITMKQYLQNPPLVCILEKGGNSYENFLTVFEGKKITISEYSKPFLSLLEISTSSARPTPKKIKKIVDLIQSQNIHLSLDFIQEKLELILIEFQNQEKPSPKDLAQSFQKHLRIPLTKEIHESLKLKEGECEPSKRQMNFILSIFELFLSSSFQKLDGFIKYDQDEVEYLIREAYRDVGKTLNRFPVISDVLQQAYHKTNNRFFAEALKKWTISGVIPYFDKPSSIKLDNSVLVVNINSGLNPQLDLIYSLIIEERFRDKLKFATNQMRVLVKEESFIDHPVYQKSLISELNESRQFGYATIHITQNLNDYYQTNAEFGKKILDLFQVKILGKPPQPTFINSLAATNLNISKQNLDALVSMKINRETLSMPFAIITSNDFEICFNQLNEYESLLCAEDLSKNLAFDFYTRIKQLSLAEVFKRIVAKSYLNDDEYLSFIKS